jgi:NADH-quinone oxidoreductase subunit J
MTDLIFYIFAGAALLFGVLVVANPVSRSPVTSAMFLVLSIVSLAGLFVQLHAFFLGAVQVLVYAGAVMVLFLFVIMLLDLPEEDRRRIKRTGLVGGGIAVAALAWIGWSAMQDLRLGGRSAPTVEGSTAALGERLFTQFLLPFEVVSVLLLVAMLGVLLLSRKDPA